jgi:phosphatidylinositol alpha-1,6-mannosyltransferase
VGFGLVFLEAAAHGLPTVAGRAGGSGEAVEDGVTGTLVNGESSRDIAHAIVQLLTTPALARAFGQAGVERTRREFSPQRFSDAWESVIASLAAPGESSVATGGHS